MLALIASMEEPPPMPILEMRKWLYLRTRRGAALGIPTGLEVVVRCGVDNCVNEEHFDLVSVDASVTVSAADFVE